jgi:carbonic anhydrase
MLDTFYTVQKEGNDMSESKNPYPVHHWAQQSPINLAKVDSLQVNFPKSFLKFDYREAPFTGHFEPKEGHKDFVLLKPHSGKNPPTITMGDLRAELVKIHLHTPSEHDLEGKNHGGEIHLIHEIVGPTTGSQLIVVGVFFDESKTIVETDFFSMWASQLTKKRTARSVEEEVSIDPRLLLPKLDRWYRYEGSLTSEPYSETVSWIVLVEPIGIDSADFRKLRKNAHQPERPVQPVSRRFVIRNFQ